MLGLADALREFLVVAASGSMVAGLRRSSLRFPPTGIGIVLATKPRDPRQGQWKLLRGFLRENEAMAREGYRLFTTNVQSYGCFGESFILVGAS